MQGDVWHPPRGPLVTRVSHLAKAPWRLGALGTAACYPPRDRSAPRRRAVFFVASHVATSRACLLHHSAASPVLLGRARSPRGRALPLSWPVSVRRRGSLCRSCLRHPRLSIPTLILPFPFWPALSCFWGSGKLDRRPSDRLFEQSTATWDRADRLAARGRGEARQPCEDSFGAALRTGHACHIAVPTWWAKPFFFKLTRGQRARRLNRRPDGLQPRAGCPF